MTPGRSEPVSERRTTMTGRFLGYDLRAGMLAVYSLERRGRRMVRAKLYNAPHTVIWETELPDGVTLEQERDAVVAVGSGFDAALVGLAEEGVAGGACQKTG